jgi:hypothetical protein
MKLDIQLFFIDDFSVFLSHIINLVLILQCADFSLITQKHVRNQDVANISNQSFLTSVLHDEQVDDYSARRLHTKLTFS